MNHRARLVATAAAAALFLGVGALAPQPAAAWTPQRPVEMVIMAGQGGGADRLARLIQSIIEKHHLSPQPFVPVNKAGGSGAEALRYLKDNAGNPHIVMATLNSYYTTPLRNPGLGVDIKNFTPIARLAEDTFLLWVNVKSGIKNLDDYKKAVMAGNGNWKMGGTGKGQEDSLVTAMLEGAYGLKMTYIPFAGGGTVAKNLVGSHVDSTVNNPSEAMAFAAAGRVRPIAAFTPERLAQFKDVPTFKEMGHDLVYYMQRSFVAPPNIPKDAEAFYVDLFKKVNDSKEWVDYTSGHALDRAFLSGDKLQDYFVAEREKHRKLLASMGEVK
jgi:putative tricarboxylic transport membrane protein